MSISGQHIKSKRWIFHLMAFAFFWLVIGDLITLHQKAIYGFDPFSIETPFAKTDNGHHKSKLDKGSKFDKFKDQYHLDMLVNKACDFKTTPSVREVEFVNTFTVFVTRSSYQLVPLRAPPIV